jgi:hypothetical protein
LALTQEQLLLAQVSEESSEVSQIAIKSIRFTLNEVYAGQGLTNKERIHQELNDLLGVVRILNREHGFGYVIPDMVNDHNGTLEGDEFHRLLNANNAAILAKEEKVKKYKGYSQDLGTVEQEVTVEDITV